MQADKWLEVNLVGLVILGGLMFVTTKVMNLSSAVNDVQINLAATAERVDRLAKALPTLATDVAQQQVSRPLRTVVIVGTPEHVKGAYRVPVSVVDPQTAQRWVGEIPLTSARDMAPIAMLAWSAYELDPQFASFTRMLGYARTVGLPTELPAQVDSQVSFVLGSVSAADWLSTARSLGFEPQPAPFTLRPVSWKELAQALRLHPGDFLGPPPATGDHAPAHRSAAQPPAGPAAHPPAPPGADRVNH